MLLVLDEPIAAQQSHNWNTLFLGASAVADVVAAKFKSDKSELLDAHADASMGVRMALGETALVRSTREFLMKNGTVLRDMLSFVCLCPQVYNWTRSVNRMRHVARQSLW